MAFDASYRKKTTTSLIILWIGSFIFFAFMVYMWQRSDNDVNVVNNQFTRHKNIFVDQLLLSTNDFQLGDKVGLININLNANPDKNFTEEQPVANNAPDRKLVYSKILQQKIEKISTDKTDGFTIKPLPQ